MKKLLVAVLVFGFAALFTQPSAHATPIFSQELLRDNNGVLESFATVSVNVAESNLLVDSVYESYTWFSLVIDGFQFIDLGANDVFYAIFDFSTPELGFLDLLIDVQNTVSGFTYMLEVSFGETFVDIFDANNQLVDFFEVILGDVTVHVPAPTTFALMLLALAGLTLRRRVQR